jgi:hypothetical protein
MERDHMVDMPRWRDQSKMDHNGTVQKGLQYTDLDSDRTNGELLRIFVFHKAREI